MLGINAREGSVYYSNFLHVLKVFFFKGKKPFVVFLSIPLLFPSFPLFFL